MGSSMALILAILWLSRFENAISRSPFVVDDSTEESTALEKQTSIFGQPDCNWKVGWRGYSVRYQQCTTWFHRECAELTIEEIRQNEDWSCGCMLAPIIPVPDSAVSCKLFSRYVDEIIRTAKATEVANILVTVNRMHKNLRFTVEHESDEGLPFLDMMSKRDDGRLSSKWYSKPTDTGLILSFRALAPTIYKTSVIQGTIHRINHATSSFLRL